MFGHGSVSADAGGPGIRRIHRIEEPILIFNDIIAAIPGDHAIEHATGVYLGLLLLACIVGIISNRITHLPYTIALTIVGLIIAVLHIGPDIKETGFGKELIFFVMLPPLLFQGAIHMQLGKLMDHFAPILTFAIVGVLLSTFLIGGMYHWFGGVESLLIAMLFGAMITPTDPVSVLALFRECNVPEDLKYLVEGESLFNDGTGVVIFTIILSMIMSGENLHVGGAVVEFFKVSIGGAILGVILGAIVFEVMRRMNDHLLENALCIVLAYGSFWLAEVIHFSGVIATVMAGLLIGNFGAKYSMDNKTRDTIMNFFESIDFLINSLLFILIGLELQEITREQFMANLQPIGVAILALVVSRAIAVYSLYNSLNLIGTKRPGKFAHVLFWGGLRGSIPIALLLGLPSHPLIDQYRPTLLVSGFGVVVFSLVGQGLTMKPLLAYLGIGKATPEGETY